MAAVDMTDMDALLRDEAALERAPEKALVDCLAAHAGLDRARREAAGSQAAELVAAIRNRGERSFFDAFLSEYGLNNDEGVALLSMAEAFLRIPDSDTLDRLLQEKLTGSDWQSHSGHAASFLVNASTWALMLTGHLLSVDAARNLVESMRRLLKRLGEPAVRHAVGEAMARLADHFVIGESIEQALARAGQAQHAGSFFSYDMLGEAARTEADAGRYFQAYQQAIAALAERADGDVKTNPGISVKLSALHPRFELPQQARSFQVLRQRLLALAEQAADCAIGLSIDAEELYRLDYSRTLLREVVLALKHRPWYGLGAVVQAYARSALPVLRELGQLARDCGKPLMVRLVKGAYWDTEVKRAQQLGLPDYPVFTRKAHTDISYLAAARTLLRLGDAVYPQFATHNAHTMTTVLQMADEEGRRDFEFQRLYGMGAALHGRAREQYGTRHRIYAPVGEHEDLLAYLVRRLLENGANSSFVHQLTDRRVPVAELAADPFTKAGKTSLPLPPDLYPGRHNSRGWEVGRRRQLEWLLSARDPFAESRWHTRPVLATGAAPGEAKPVYNPARPDEQVGTVREASEADIATALELAVEAQDSWAGTAVAERAALLRETAELLAGRAGETLALLTRESGKTLNDAVSEWREAIDFLRYYAAESAYLDNEPHGTFVCISPWNFPLAIFTGQIAAALAAGNTVLAKPAEQTPLIAGFMAGLFHEAGVPRRALQLLPGDGPRVGATLCGDSRIGGVCFTGSLDTARAIHRAMAAAQPFGTPLIAETGGINAMIVDSTALPEQAVQDVVTSAFTSAGQRCSALRILYLQEEVADGILTMLTGAMEALTVDDPWALHADLGPVIDGSAKAAIEQAVARYPVRHRLSAPQAGHYVAPVLIEVGGITELDEEVFGPVLFVARYRAEDLSRVIDDINAAGYGLTFGMHSRLLERTERCVGRLRIGNMYINRNQIGAVVQSQPFGGEGLSGTGPKAGGPHYLPAFQRPARISVAAATGMAASGPALAAEVVQQALSGLDNGPWAARDDRLQSIERVLPGAVEGNSCRYPRQTVMPGPTGERNRYQLFPLDKVLCLGPAPAHALQQCTRALAAGCAVLVVCPADTALTGRLQMLAGAGAPVAHLPGCLPAAELTQISELPAVAWSGDDAGGRALRQALAAREGAIVRLISPGSPPSRFLHERHVCNDTTRAGGNIELMARQAD